MPRKLRPCGTVGGWQRHKDHGEKPCPRCAAAKLAASNEAVRRHRARLREFGFRYCRTCGGCYPQEAYPHPHEGYRPGLPPGWPSRDEWMARTRLERSADGRTDEGGSPEDIGGPEGR